MRIEKWSIGQSPNPYIAPEVREKVLQGYVFRHPAFEDGDFIVTTGIVGARNGRIVTRSGSEYELGEVDPAYEATYPGAKARALAMDPPK